MKFNEILRELRIEAGMKQTDAAKALNISATGYANWEQGYRKPSIEDLPRLAKLFNVTTDYLLGLEN